MIYTDVCFTRENWAARLIPRLTVLALLLALGFAHNTPAQTPLPLGLNNNYMVTGDYVVGGWNKSGSTTVNGTLMSTGTIKIPDSHAYAANVSLQQQQVPAGADIVAAFLYWETVENSGIFAGKSGFFQNGSGQLYPITGAPLGNPNAPVSWSSGGCAGSSQGSKTMVAYRADVSALMPLDANGNIVPNTSYQVTLPDTGKSGQPPFALGATLVIIYRVLGSNYPLNAVVIYDGAYAPSNTAQVTSQPLQGFYQAGNDKGAPIVAKLTHLVGNGQSNKLESVYLNNYNGQTLVHSTLLPSIYPGNPPFPGAYNTTWDNPTWFVNDPTYTTTPAGASAVQANESLEAAVVIPASSNKGCVSWGAVIMSTTVQDSDHDGILDVWKLNPNGNPPGYCDAGSNRGLSTQGTCAVGDPSWVGLPGALPGNQDIFVQLDYMCSKVNPDGTCDPSGVSYKPQPDPVTNQDPISLLVNAFRAHNKVVHPVWDDNNVILAQACVDSAPLYCPFPGAAGAGVVGWKLGYSFLKTQPLNYPDEASCESSGPACIRRFQPGKNISYHQVIFARASATPNWTFLDGSLANATTSSTTMTFTTKTAHGLQADPTDTGIANGRISISNAISNPSLNGTYLVQTVPSPTSFTVRLAAATTAPTAASDPLLSLTSAVLSAASGVSDVGGADSLVSLGLWGADGQTWQVESGTTMHELGHSLGLTHGGLNPPPQQGGPPFIFEPNCKANYLSVMNYLFQVDLLDGNLDYSSGILPTINETQTTAPGALGSTNQTTKWYVLNKPFGVGSAATSHCDGTPLLLTDQPVYRVQGPLSSVGWSGNQDTNFDGSIAASLDGYDDWDNLDLRQVGATGNDFWVGGGVKPSGTGGGVKPSGTGGGVKPSGTGGGVKPSGTGGGVGEITIQAASSAVRTPTNLSATLTASSSVLLSWTPPSFGQSQIAAFNVYRSVNSAPFAFYTTDSVTGTPLPLPNPSNYTDTKVTCDAKVSYFVTTVLSDGRESVPSNTTVPISVPCIFVGFLSPLSAASTAPALPTFSGPRNLGNAVPVKWELLDANNNPVSDLTTLTLIQACSTTGPTSAPGSTCVQIYSPLTGGEGSTTFRYSAPNFIVNWDTGSSSHLTHGYWTLELQLSDGRMEWTNLSF